jgi:hypothetical protein
MGVGLTGSESNLEMPCIIFRLYLCALSLTSGSIDPIPLWSLHRKITPQTPIES